MKVAVLGCGPAGLLAATAAEQRGHDVSVLSKREPSWIGGAQYVHTPITEVTGIAGDRIEYVRLGMESGYAKKVYGDEQAETSWEAFGKYAIGYPLKPMYEHLYGEWLTRIQNINVQPMSIERLVDDYDTVISSIPRPALCWNPDRIHTFNSAAVRIVTEVNSIVKLPENVIVYSGRPKERWYRASNLWGNSSVEFPVFKGEVGNGVKPLTHDCDCHAEWGVRLHHVGRFGTWMKGVLISDAYDSAHFHLEQLEQSGVRSVASHRSSRSSDVV